MGGGRGCWVKQHVDLKTIWRFTKTLSTKVVKILYSKQQDIRLFIDE